MMLDLVIGSRRISGLKIPGLLVSASLVSALAGSAVHAGCTVNNSGVAFGIYNPLSAANADSTGMLTVVADASGCGSFTIALGRTGASYSPRTFTTGPIASFAYNLYTSATRSTIWGDGTSGTQTVTSAALAGSATRILTVYGRIPASQPAAPGSYSAQATISATTTSGTISAAAPDTITAAISAACSISATNLAFGIYNGAALNASATVTVNCTSTTSYNVALNPGTAAGAAVTSRKMQSGSNLLNYALFSNSGRTLNWGQTIGTDTVAGTGSGSAQALTIYGRIAAGQYIPPGSYADTIIATVTY